MTDLQAYLDRIADPEVRALLLQQWSAAVDKRAIRCCCGKLRAIELAYRCLYCGIWFCGTCAEDHFGKTILEHIHEKRAERRRAFKQTRAAATSPNA